MPLSPAPALRGARVELTALGRKDREAWVALWCRNRDWLRPYELTVPPSQPGQPSPPSPQAEPSEAGLRAGYAAMLRAQRRQARTGTGHVWALRVPAQGGAPLGQVSLSCIEGGGLSRARLGYWIDEEHAQRGLGSEAVRLVVAWAFHDAGLHRVEAEVHPENAPSLALLDGLGFVVEGRRVAGLHTRRGWEDHLLLARTAGR